MKTNEPSSTPSTAGKETLVWRGTSSQVKHLGVYVVCLLTCWLVVPIFIALYRYIQLRCRVYELTSERLRITSGWLSKSTELVELYRIKDMEFLQPFFYRLFGLGHVILFTSDRTAKNILIEAIAQPQQLLDRIRNCVEICRQKKGVREMDFDDMSSAGPSVG